MASNVRAETINAKDGRNRCRILHQMAYGPTQECSSELEERLRSLDRGQKLILENL